MVYTVTFNPAMDYIMKTDKLELGQTNRSKEEYFVAGGKGINVSIVLNRLGEATCALGFVAGFTGEQIEKLVKEEGCKTDFIQLKDGMSRINVKLKMDKETEINAAGPDISSDALERLYEQIKCIGDDDVLVLAGNVPSTVSKNIYSHILSLLMGRKTKTVVDASGELLTNALRYRPFLVKPNRSELEEIYNVKITGMQTAAQYGRRLQKDGARNVLVSMGGDGAVLICEDGKVYKGEVMGGPPINTVGAGDSMIAGFIYEYMRSHDYSKALRMGLCAGGATAESEYLATGEAIRRLYNWGK